MATLIADVTALRALADRLRTISSELDTGTTSLVSRAGLDEHTTGSRAVTGAVGEFEGSWDEARARTVEAVDAAARFFDAAAERLGSDDSRLASDLSGTG